MLVYKGQGRFEDYKADFDIQIGTLLGAVKYKLNLNDSDINGLYIFGSKVKTKSKEIPTDDEDSDQVEDSSGNEPEKQKKKITDKLKRIWNYVKTYLNDDRYKNVKNLLVDRIIRLLKHVFPCEISGYLHYGMEDPSDTGKILALLAVIVPLAKNKFEVTPEWNQAIIEGNTKFSGRIHLTYILYTAFCIWFNKDFQSLWRERNGRNN